MAQRKIRRQKRKASSQRPLRSDAKPLETYKPSFIGRDESVDGRASARRGQGYEEFCRTDWPERIAAGDATNAEAATALDVPAANISRWMAAWTEDRTTDARLSEWAPDPVDVAAIDGGYETFVSRFHPEALIRDYDSEWESHIDDVVGRAGQLLLLAPQRHGKTEFLARYCQRRITQDPDVRILWVGRTQELAEEAVGFVRQLLEDEDYGEAVLGPGQTFQPATRSGRSWTDKKFTVSTRQAKHKSPTMRALGIGGTTSGRDADLIIIDDPQEREDIEGGATAGDKQRKWFFTTFLARKMPHTGIAYITSRKHPKDIPGVIIDQHADDWRVVTYRAHDIACIKPESKPEEHVDCVMWPERRPFSALMKQKRADELWFECNYQNNPTTEKLTLVTAEHIEDATDDRVIAGYFRPGMRLVAGFDPATRKENAAVLWAYDPKDGKTQIVTAKKFPTGPLGLASAMEEWHDRFRVIDWVTEVNLSGGFLQDTQVVQTMRALGIRVTSHYTDRYNKVDVSGGVTSMLQTIRNPDLPITFPSLDTSEDSEGVRELIRQALGYDPDGNKHAPDDLVLAAWFPWWKKLRKVVEGRRSRDSMQIEYESFGNPLGGF